MISGERGVNEVTSCKEMRSNKTLKSTSFLAKENQYIPPLTVNYLKNNIK